MLTWYSFFQGIDRLGRSAVRRAGWLLMSFCRYSAIVAAGVILSAALTILFARLDREGRTALTVYAETEAGMPQQEETDPAYSVIKPDTWKEGQELVGATVAEGVFALREAREQRQEDIERAKAAIQEAENRQVQRVQNGEISRVMEVGGSKAQEKDPAQSGPGAVRKSETENPEESARQASAGIHYSQKDYEVLQRIVEAEAGICDTKGRILVANVVINRVKSNEFPDTITGVVYQKSQFSPVQDGSLNRCTVTPETVEAVDRALAGEDYSQGALYFMNRRRSRSGNVSWFDNSLTYLFQHDRHEFFK